MSNLKRSSPLFCDVGLSARIERVEAQLIAQSSEAARRRSSDAGFVIHIGGGVASFAGQGSPLNKVAGLGFDGVPDAAAFDQLEDAFAARRTAVHVELAHLGDPAIGVLLTGRGYRLTGFENVLGLRLTGDLQPVTPPGVEVRVSGEDDFDSWLDVVTEGFTHPDTHGPPSHEEFPADVLRRVIGDTATTAGVMRYTALHEEAIVGGARLRMIEGVAQLSGAATAPRYRRRGIQTALLSARLADSATAGCDLAVITTSPGSKSQQNAQRQGFDLLYTRAILVKQPSD